MAIKSIVVHPKGATHIQKLNTKNFFMKKESSVDGSGDLWLFWADSIFLKKWILDNLVTNSLREGNAWVQGTIHPIR